MDWVARNAVLPAIATMSLGVPESTWSQVLADAVLALIALNVTCVVAAGNSAQVGWGMHCGSIITRHHADEDSKHVISMIIAMVFPNGLPLYRHTHPHEQGALGPCLADTMSSSDDGTRVL
jgi:hypothetical protein